MSPGLPIDGICLSGFLCAKKRIDDKAKPMTNAPRSASASIAEVVEVIEIRGTHAANAPPQLLIEVPHGATRTEHFTTLAGWLHGDYPADLIDFFHVNTDVGAPELGPHRRTFRRRIAKLQRGSSALPDPAHVH
ncbi:MAG: hypothetical protein WCR59_06000 [Planctomycetota bacterium]